MILASTLIGQEHLSKTPGYDRYIQASQLDESLFQQGSLQASWEPDGTAFYFQKDGKTWRFDLTSKQTTPAKNLKFQPQNEDDSRYGPDRGRQFETVLSPDKK